MFRLAHLSDPHLGPLPDTRIRELLSKRVIGYVNWHRSRARSMTATWLDGIVEDIHESAPDHIAVTGDLVNIALDLEISAARHWLDALAPPDLASLVPGNHDAYVPGALRRALHAWSPYMTGDDCHEPAFPFVRRRGPVAIVGVSSARASGPWFATGRVGSRQARAFRETLVKLGDEGAFRVVMIHHPPQRGATGWHKRLTDASRVRAAIKRSGCELVLHGHTHLATRVEIDGPRGPVPVIGVPSASNAPGHKRPAARYNLFSISGSPGNWNCEMEERGYRASASGDKATVEHLASRHLVIPG
ncbi:metallophosphoesterase [Stappia stellulata]|uniref:metallophosphoesterase family protein n=1 Tax=Stappia stellulata TaxID=71235 RepID=UPI001CD1A609|nr:metallophosphoesterase [Stappia stellulata]MCA1242299.1 metallophosphoesterase [Stappia stellulata]